MQNLQVFFINHFDTDRLSDDTIRKFSEDHLQRLLKSGAYPALAAALESAYTGYFGAITDEATKAAIRQGLTKNVELAVKAIKKNISQQEGTIRGKFDKGSAQYQEFFPQGVTEYSDANLSNIEEKLIRFINAATAHAADLPGLATQFGVLHTQYKASRNVQLATKGEVATGKAQSSSTRDAVEVQLMTNLLTIALDHIGDSAAGLAYFDQVILAGGNYGTKPESKPSP